MIASRILTDLAQARELRDEWAGLHRAVAPGTPFEHPDWLLPWAEQELTDEPIVFVTVRDDDRLIGVAPLYLWRLGPRGFRAAALRPFGTGRADGLTEVVALLANAERTGEVVRAVLEAVEQVPGWQWLQLSLGPGQGWLVPQWVPERDSRLILHRGVRPSVIKHLQAVDRVSLLGDLKRNVRESVRRGTNRARRLGDVSFDVCESPEAVEEGVRRLAQLHHLRARMSGAVRHADLVGSEFEFLVTASSRLATDGNARVHLARHRDTVIASQLVLSDGRTDYLSISGLDPAYWELSLNTLLIFEAMVYAAKQGRSAVNLSTGPDVAKLRWSNDVVVHHDFTVVRGDPRSRLAFSLYAHLGMTQLHRNERARHRRR